MIIGALILRKNDKWEALVSIVVEKKNKEIKNMLEGEKE